MRHPYDHISLPPIAPTATPAHVPAGRAQSAQRSAAARAPSERRSFHRSSTQQCAHSQTASPRAPPCSLASIPGMSHTWAHPVVPPGPPPPLTQMRSTDMNKGRPMREDRLGGQHARASVPHWCASERKQSAVLSAVLSTRQAVQPFQTPPHTPHSVCVQGERPRQHQPNAHPPSAAPNLRNSLHRAIKPCSSLQHAPAHSAQKETPNNCGDRSQADRHRTGRTRCLHCLPPVPTSSRCEAGQRLVE